MRASDAGRYRLMPYLYSLYEDDGKSFECRHGDWKGIEVGWNDARQSLSLRLAKGSKMLGAKARDIEVHLNGRVHPVRFEGRPVSLDIG